MLALERRNLILEKLQEEKRVVVSELSQLYSVSEETIRRDLDKLEKEGLATKSYGGAVINEDVGIDLPFNVRKNQNVQGKQKMAEIAASMVNDGDHIFLDASTTAVFVAKALKEKERLTVVTNSMEILLELSDVSGWNIISRENRCTSTIPPSTPRKKFYRRLLTSCIIPKNMKKLVQKCRKEHCLSALQEPVKRCLQRQ